jgi:hypothetical protein
MTGSNQLTGMIATELGGLTSLTELYLGKIDNVLCCCTSTGGDWLANVAVLLPTDILRRLFLAPLLRTSLMKLMPQQFLALSSPLSSKVEVFSPDEEIFSGVQSEQTCCTCARRWREARLKSCRGDGGNDTSRMTTNPPDRSSILRKMVTHRSTLETSSTRLDYLRNFQSPRRSFVL